MQPAVAPLAAYVCMVALSVLAQTLPAAAKSWLESWRNAFLHKKQKGPLCY